MVASLNVDIQLQTAQQAGEWKRLLRPYCKTIRAVCETAIGAVPASALKRKKSLEMTVVLADDAFIRRLNHDYRGKDKATNVLSFPNDEGGHIGDVVLALETLLREAGEQGKSPKHHAIHLLAHGTLHLLGYDHMEEKEATRMESLEVKIMKKLGIANPYL